MKPSAMILQIPRQPNLNQIAFLLVFCLLLLIIIPLYQPPFLDPFQHILPWRPSSPPSSEPANVESPSSNTTSCNVFSGDWVPVPDAPYYTNLTCSIIQESRNCLLFGRPNTDYLRWRWRPDGCELPLFNPVKFLEIVRNKSMAFVGDSLARNHMQSLLCLLSSVEIPKDISETQDEDYKLMYYEKHNFTIRVFWSAFLVRTVLPENNDLNGLWTLYLDEVDENWAPYIAGFDYVIVSDGNWYVKQSLFYEKRRLVGCNRCMFDGVSDLSLLYSNRRAFRTAFSALNKMEGFKGKIFLRTLSPDHFENGDWDTGGDCPRTRPYDRNRMTMYPLTMSMYTAQIEEFWAAEKVGRRRGLEYKLMDATQAMLLRPDGHPSRYGQPTRTNKTHRNDCVHWCLPGPIDLWNEFLFHTMNT